MENIVLKASHLKHLKICTESDKMHNIMIWQTSKRHVTSGSQNYFKNMICLGLQMPVIKRFDLYLIFQIENFSFMWLIFSPKLEYYTVVSLRGSFSDC